jgi:hypothetical protein
VRRQAQKIEVIVCKVRSRPKKIDPISKSQPQAKPAAGEKKIDPISKSSQQVQKI